MFTTKSYRGTFKKNNFLKKKNLIFAQNGRLDDENNSKTCFDAYHIEDHMCPVATK